MTTLHPPINTGLLILVIPTAWDGEETEEGLFEFRIVEDCPAMDQNGEYFLTMELVLFLLATEDTDLQVLPMTK